MTAPTDAGMVELIERLEKATGPDRELDVDIHWAVNRASARVSYNNAKLGLPLRLEDLPDCLKGGLGRDGVRAQCPHYTSSIDAALTLVPEGSEWILVRDLNGFGANVAAKIFRTPDLFHCHEGKTPALALCIAALRTRSPA